LKGDNKVDDDFRQLKTNDAEKVLRNIGIEMCDPDGSYRPFNEVMTDLGKTIKHIRETTDEKQFEILRDNIYHILVGIRYKNQFKF